MCRVHNLIEYCVRSLPCSGSGNNSSSKADNGCCHVRTNSQVWSGKLESEQQNVVIFSDLGDSAVFFEIEKLESRGKVIQG